MARSLSLSAYLAYSKRSGKSDLEPADERPEGMLLWGHAERKIHVNALLQLHDRLLAMRPDLSLLLTTSDQLAESQLYRRKQVIFERLPYDSVADARVFFEHWRPNLALWTGGDLQPALLDSAAEMSIPMALVDADEDLLSRPSWRWFPDLPRALLRRFEFVMARDEKSARFLRRMGVANDAITTAGRFLDGAVSLPVNESDREELAAILLGRPVWLAAMAQEQEVKRILQAHVEVSRLSHRALVIIVPDDIEMSDVFADHLENSGQRYIRWSEGEFPNETTQVVLADTRGEMGLWYRLAPISFMGSSLDANARGCDPNEPAAHGSAILHGPGIERYKASYTRFRGAGAARLVKDEIELANTVKQLIPPDQTAAMAHAAWEVASRSASLTDQIAERINDRLDSLEGN
ncbi:MAG: glycosyltransferase N-terminal domain-containing protein [Pseudomonadota bacterium]